MIEMGWNVLEQQEGIRILLLHPLLAADGERGHKSTPLIS